jgi:hypothetical protein
MTSQGHAYSRFRRALQIGNPRIAEAAARELTTISAADALSLLLLYQREPERYERAAARWIALFIAEQPSVRLDEVALLAALLRSLGRLEDSTALDALATVLGQRGLRVNR